ncbi:hypothetical protein BDY19DRAFT_988332 [Irpex rosettiformis]|uniref:Uncharacterized protein n=1 Tax=Irpex rosettiformis TaxID=378272 RepID=A0ACB8UJY4_9APHY|nr:hypothetical protein BDY19DRAFT_988332 [Irpex rosettiformis]
MAANGDHWRLQLNNLLQRSYGTAALRWECQQFGPQHTAPWTVVAYINGVEYGRGQGHTQGDAKERAANMAYSGLFAELSRIMSSLISNPLSVNLNLSM